MVVYMYKGPWARLIRKAQPPSEFAEFIMLDVFEPVTVESETRDIGVFVRRTTYHLGTNLPR